ncbi:cupin domain-containing protein [Paracoccus nototheniae]|uniref:Cupin domain-containing protein n=3 Tax=Paracoccus nototheniae TaxID=2489002 RepID=A0ABW4DTJ0_9RHOB
MTRIVRLTTMPDFTPRPGQAAPDRLIEGDPRFQTWELDQALPLNAGWTKIQTGVWEATPGVTRSLKGEAFEYCHILSGHCRIAEDGGDSHDFVAGDSFLLKPGFEGVWTTLETVRKIYVFAS